MIGPIDDQEKRDIPKEIKREVRQRCGFGCVICGIPLVDYDHMIDWAEVKRHEASNITLLCDMHHKEKGKGLLPLAQVQDANKNPFNLRIGKSSPYLLHYSGKDMEVVLGGNKFTAELSSDRPINFPLLVDKQFFIGFGLFDGHLLLNLQFFDEFNYRSLNIIENQLVYSLDSWDIEFRGRRLIIRQAKRRIAIDIEFSPPNRVVISRGRFLCNGVEILIHPDRLTIKNSHIDLKNLKFKNCPIGVSIGPDPIPGTCLSFEQIPRYLPKGKA